MKSLVLLAALLTSALNPCALHAAEETSPFDADKAKEANPVSEARPEGLADGLLGRCRKMLALQTAAYDGSAVLRKVIDSTPGKTPRLDRCAAARKLAALETPIIAEATNAIAMLKAEGSAAAFYEIFEALRDDMKRLQRRLQSGNVGSATQALARDLLDTLKEMIQALKKPSCRK